MGTDEVKRVFPEKLLVIFLVFSPVLTTIFTNQSIDPVTQTWVGVVLILVIGIISIVAIITDANEKKSLAEINVKMKDMDTRLKQNENDNNAKIAIAQAQGQNQTQAALGNILSSVINNPVNFDQLLKYAEKMKATQPEKPSG